MRHVLVGLTWKDAVPYLDDCIIKDTRRTHEKIATIISLISKGESKNQANEMRLFSKRKSNT